MSAATKGLGKGLSALMGEEYSQTVSTSNTPDRPDNTLPLDQIVPGIFQPRTHFDEEFINELADSIEKNGVMQPIIVRPKAGQAGIYEIIAGERRWRASKLAKLTKIPVIIRDIDDKLALELALVENVQRQDLNALEEAAGYQRLIDDFSYTQETIARTVGKSRSHVANLLRILGLPEEVRGFIRQGSLTIGHAKAIAGSKDLLQLANQIVRDGLTVRQAETLAKGEDIDTPQTQSNSAISKSAQGPAKMKMKDKDADIIALEATLSESLGLNVSINVFGSQQGEVLIRYGSLTQLDEVLRRLSGSV